jgi:ribonucleoside-diphosphate reductase alpha chain
MKVRGRNEARGAGSDMAMAPQQLGIGIRRHFTRPGVDPYDTVEWERRDSRIPNFKDGGDAFFQPDVEFPKSWSLNATNIVAQKYFRGTLGTPEREWSLRQVIDRVADTITDWGMRDGYFVDSDEADAFRAELKYLLVHQRAAFNSPVWFNIGVKGVPQQASACQPYDALVATPEGLVPIGKLVEERAVGTKVFDANGLTRIVAVKHNGRKPVLRVHTKAGLALDVTGDHLVRRLRRGERTGWAAGSELAAGDQLEWYRSESLGDTLIQTGECENVEIERIEELGEMDVYDIQTESGEYLSNHLRVHNCFILAVDDTMDAILNWYREEGIIFKGGSGAGINLSAIRSSVEHLQGGGTASGPVSFMRGADASAGTIKSGGKTRRAAKMVILNADHPDIEDFIWCKAIEERKARALRDAGFDMDLDGKDSHSIQYQNANNSVRVTDEFMQAVLEDREWTLRAVKTGEPTKTMPARDLMHQIAQSAWECADPGVQFDTTINRWHTASNTGRINASNPCFTGDSLVHTDKGLVPFADMLNRARRGESFGVYTHDATNPDAPAERVEITRPEAIMVTGFNEIVRLRFSNGMELRCTSSHKIFTENRGYVAANELTAEDDVKILTLPAPAVAADWALPAEARLFALAGKGDRVSRTFRLPEKWTPELGHYIGWVVGDRCISGDVVTTIYGSSEECEHILPAHRELATWLNDGVESTPSTQSNGTVQLRQSRRVIARLLAALGVSRKKAAQKVVPHAINEAPPEIVAAFLRGLFDADGCVYDGENYRYVGLGSASRELLVGVQRLLSTFGVFSRIYATGSSGPSFEYTRKDGTQVVYEGGAMFDLRIANRSIVRFAEHIGFMLPTKSSKLERLLATHHLNTTKETVRLVDRADDGIELTFNLSEPRNHSYVVNGVIVRNCSEYMHLDNSACNLASINLLTFLNDDDTFDVEGYKHAVEVMFTAQEILVGNADYPTEKIAETSRAFRQLGLGYANLGALLMALGMPYDSNAGRAWASALTAVMTGHAYATSAKTAARMGPFAGYAANEEPMLDVLRMHRAETAKIDAELVPAELLSAAHQAWDEAVELGEQYGVRNAQSSVIAPTGTIALMMDCDTTGIEPDLALTKAKKLVGGGTMLIVNQTIPRALRRLGYSHDQVAKIVGYIDEHKSLMGAPGFNVEHLPVFACSMGDNTIHYMGHVNMMAAVQPWISGAISKTVNLPEDVTVDDVADVYTESWRLGLKAVAIYRDNCKVAQPLATQKKSIVVDTVAGEVERIVETIIVQEPVRQKLPRTRRSRTFSFRVADCHGYVTVGEYEDGRPGEVFLKVAKQGSTLAGIMDAFAISVSHGLQYGVPLEAFVEMFTNMRFEPAGMTDDPDIRFSTSLVDYIFRRLAVEYMDPEKREAMGIMTVGERLQPTLPGVDEATIPVAPSIDLPPDDRPPSASFDRTSPPARPTPHVRDREVVLCHVCGDMMQRAGSCYACPSCGSTSGCS